MDKIKYIIGVLGSYIAGLFGGWNIAIETLLIFMAIDYITGIMVAAIFKNSTKTNDGGLKSSIGFNGLCRKGMILLFVLIAYRLDLVLNTSYIKDCVCITFIANELVSITENAGLMGLPLPKIIIDAIDILKNKENNRGSN